MSKSVMSVSVCIALLAASAAVSGAYAANNKNSKSSAISSTNVAYAALVNGRDTAAIQNYSVAIESRQLTPDLLARSLLNRALAFQHKGDNKSAINDYTAAMRLDALSPKTRAVALYNRGLAHEKIKNAAMAIEDFTGALLLDPQFSQSYYSRGNVLRQHGQYLLAIADYKKARRFNHSKPHLTYFGEALTYEALNKTPYAKSMLQKAVKIKPDFAAAIKKLATFDRIVAVPVVAQKPIRKPIRIAMINPVSLSDGLVTGSISPNQSDLVIRKSSLPAPIGVPKTISSASVVTDLPPLPKLTKPNPSVKKQATTAKTVVTATVPENGTPTPRVAAISTTTGWTVQLSSQRNSAAAWKAWEKLSSRHASLLKKQQAAVTKADLGTRGIFYRLRVHKLSNKKQARSLCSRLKRSGTSCFVSKT